MIFIKKGWGSLIISCNEIYRQPFCYFSIYIYYNNTFFLWKIKTLTPPRALFSRSEIRTKAVSPSPDAEPPYKDN
jgi:hypothetical protein